MPEALPHQISGALWLAARRAACLADEPRVGKTGTAIIAADLVEAQRILVVTTASGRAVWEAGFKEWSIFQNRRVVACYSAAAIRAPAEVRIIGWQQLGTVAGDNVAFNGVYDLLILDESHYAKNPEAKRTAAAYKIVPRAKRVWCLTGTPIPNAPNDLWPMLRALAPERLGHDKSFHGFTHRFCEVERRYIGGRSVEVVKGGRNEAELAALLDGFMLRRTQADVGIRQPVFETFPLHLTEARKRWMHDKLGDVDTGQVLLAAETGETRGLDMALSTIRRVTGEIKALGVAAAVREEFECGLDKIVLMAWHTDVIAKLAELLDDFGVLVVDGSTPPKVRAAAEIMFREQPVERVFIGQIQAAGEAIDLSAAAELMFVESSFVPKDMKQAALRITNHTQKRQCRVRVAALQGSIDESLARILVRKMASIREVLR